MAIFIWILFGITMLGACNQIRKEFPHMRKRYFTLTTCVLVIISPFIFAYMLGQFIGEEEEEEKEKPPSTGGIRS